MLDTKAIAEATAVVVKAHVAALVEPLREAVAALEKRIDALPVPRDGRDADEEAIVARVRGEVSAELKDLRCAIEAIPTVPPPPNITEMIESSRAAGEAHAQEIDSIKQWVDERLEALPVPRDGKDADPELIKQLVDEAVAALPPAPAGKDADPEVVRQMVAEAVAALPVPKDGIDGRDGVAGAPGRDGNDADPVTAEQVEAAVIAHLEANPPPAGKDADPIDPDMVRSMVAEIVEPVVAAIPQPRDGKDAEPELIKQMVAEAVAELPPAKDGRDAEPIDLDEVRSMVVEIVEPVLAAIPVPQDGKSVIIDDVRPIIEDAVARAVAALPKAKDGEPGKDGVGVAGAVIDRDGSLVVTLSNGDTRQLGPVVGRDGEPGKPGHDGFALKGFEVELMEDGRTILMKFDDGGPFSYTRELGVPAMIYRGVYREGVYQKGDTVTFGGSLWHSNKDGNTEKPDTGSGAWTLAAKRGRDGKDAA
ncbi:MAG: hypothetical protein WBB98_15305 [Xanthobacteraceae bacterium]